MQRAFLLAVALAACSGGSTAGGGHTTKPPPPATIDAGVASAAPLTVRECDDLISHAVALAGSGSATAAEQETVAAGLRNDLGVRCASLPRAAYVCAMAATKLGDLAVCDRLH
jgi:hypothetical protein